MKLHAQVAAGCALLALAACSGNEFSSAQDRTWGGELIEIPATTWIDPDGCEHWVFDTGAEGFMTPKFTRDGLPVCGPEALVAANAQNVPGALTFGSISGPAQVGTVDYSLSTDAFFDIGSATLRPETFRDLDRFFGFLDSQGVTDILVIGHTDSTDSEAFNLDLSLRRAISVADYAERYGITALARGLGEAQPALPNDTEDGRARNRRVEISILN